MKGDTNPVQKLKSAATGKKKTGKKKAMEFETSKNEDNTGAATTKQKKKKQGQATKNKAKNTKNKKEPAQDELQQENNNETEYQQGAAASELLTKSTGSSPESSEESDDGIPDEHDICFEAEEHPGTEQFLKVVRKSLEKFGPVAYSPKVYRGIKKQLSGRRFFVCDDDDNPFDWREVTKSELIDFVWKYYEEEKENYD
jgi:hypothetical protein